MIEVDWISPHQMLPNRGIFVWIHLIEIYSNRMFFDRVIAGHYALLEDGRWTFMRGDLIIPMEYVLHWAYFDEPSPPK